MYITVRLLNNFSKKLTYSVPDTLQHAVFVGVLVQVPLQRRIESAIVLSIDRQGTIYPFVVKSIDSIFPFPADRAYAQFTAQLSHFHQIDPLYLYKRVKNFLTEQQDDEVVDTAQEIIQAIVEVAEVEPSAPPMMPQTAEYIVEPSASVYQGQNGKA